MPLTLRVIHDRLCPIIVCDACHGQITHGREGNYEWDDDAAQPVLYFSHKACTNRLRAKYPDINCWGSLSALPAFLVGNLKMTWQESEKAAELAESF